MIDLETPNSAWREHQRKYCTTTVKETLHHTYFNKDFSRLCFWIIEEKGKVFLKVKLKDEIYSLVNIFHKKIAVTESCKLF